LIEVELGNLTEQHVLGRIGVTGSAARCRQRGGTRREREAPKDPSGHDGVGDHREDSHPPATFRTTQRVELEDPLKEIGPREALPWDGLPSSRGLSQECVSRGSKL